MIVSAGKKGIRRVIIVWLTVPAFPRIAWTGKVRRGGSALRSRGIDRREEIRSVPPYRGTMALQEGFVSPGTGRGGFYMGGGSRCRVKEACEQEVVSRTYSRHGRSQDKPREADGLFRRAIAIGKKTLGPDHPVIAGWLNNRAGLLADQVSADLVVLMATRREERTRLSGSNRSRIPTDFCFCQGLYDEADSSYTEAIAIGERSLGPSHPEVAGWLNNRALLLVRQVRLGRVRYARVEFCR